MRRRVPVADHAMAWRTIVALSLVLLVPFGFVGCSLEQTKGNSAPPPMSLKDSAKNAGVAYPMKRLFIRVHKKTRELELWGANDLQVPFKLVKTYPIAAMSGELGPKRREGDLQVPEGWYRINRFNPKSQFHLSLGLDYPNEADRLLGDKSHPGSDIFIHGGAKSIGCLAMTDAGIDEIYGAAITARDAGQQAFFVLILPMKISDQVFIPTMKAHPTFKALWKQLAGINNAFESTHVPPNVKVDSKGNYRL